MKKILLLRNGLMTILMAWVVIGGNIASAKPFAYVANSNPTNSDVSVIDTASNAVVATVVVGISPQDVAITPDGSRAYVANSISGNVSLIDTATNTVVDTIGVGNNPENVAISPDGSRAYVANQSSDNISVIDTVSNTVMAAIGVGRNPRGIAITPDGFHAYVANSYSSNVSVINTTSNTVVATIGVGRGPVGVAITPDGSRVYVTNYYYDNYVSVIDTTSNAVVTTIGVGSFPHGIAITPDGSRAYVANYSSNTVSMINTATNAVVGTIGVGQGPYDVAFTPEGSRAYVTNISSSNVSVIDTATNVVVATVGTGSNPRGLAITPNTKPVANAGGNKSVLVWDTVELDGTGSTDSDGDPLTFNWSFVSKPAGSTATLSGATSPTESFVADVSGTYDVNLTVNDGLIDSDPDSASILALTVLNSMTLVLDEATVVINNIPPEDLKNPNMENALTLKINAVLKMIEEEQYQEALDKLTDDILTKTDGCAKGGEPDKTDWIKTCEEQDAVYSLLIEAISIVKSQI